jgi:RNA polymerase sigma-70 factor (ECF subfamily)
MAAKAEATPAARDALESLCELYWPPLYSYARRLGYSVEHAQDVTQAFFARFLEKRDVRAADPARGRFRSFLLASFKHFLSNERDRERTLKRGGGHIRVGLEVETAEALYASQLADKPTPESLFERHWALGVIDRGLARLHDECVAAGKAETFKHLQGFLVGEKSPGGYATVAQTLGTTEGSIKVTVHRLRRRLRELLKEEIAPTVSDDSEIEEEVRHLIAVLTR